MDKIAEIGNAGDVGNDGNVGNFEKAGSVGNDRLTNFLIQWDTAQQNEYTLILPQPVDESCFLDLPIHASIKSMLGVDLLIKDVNDEQVHEIIIVVEWAGNEHIYALLPEQARKRAHKIVFRARDFTFAGTVLTIGLPIWLPQRPLIPIHTGESLLDMFTSDGYYRVDMWNKEGSDAPATAVDDGLNRDWNFARLKLTIPQDGPANKITYSRDYDHDIREFQAFIVCISIETKGRFSLRAVIDGEVKLLIDSHKGAGMEELRVPIQGNKLQGITIELASDSEGQHLAHLYWFMLESCGADPQDSNEISSIPDIEDPITMGAAESEGLPLKLLFDDTGLAQLKQTISSGTGKRFYEEIIAEADLNQGYRPESYVGTYFPAYWANQGIERASVPYEKTRHWFSTLVYSSLAYLLGGELKYGLSARRALLALIQCQEWCGGFLCRIPKGITGYRAPFYEAHLMQGVALCYDFIGNLLSAEEKRAVEDAVYEKAIPALDMFLRKNKDGYLLESNQGAVYASGILYACLVARRSHPDVDTILARQSEWCLRMIDNYYKADGTTGEGMMYWEYTTHYVIECLMLIARQRNKTVLDIAPSQLKEGMQYVLHMRSLNDNNLGFLPIGDCKTDSFLYMGPSLLFFAKYYEDTSAYWMWHQYYDRSYQPGSSFFGSELSTGQYTTNGLLTLLLYEDRAIAEAALPDSQRFECDRIFWRTGSRESDLLLFFEGGRQSFEHTHYDKGQFIIQANGEFLAADPGMIYYSKPGHVHYVQSAYHNIVTIRGKNQSYKNAEQAVKISVYDNDEQFNYLKADLANSYKELERYDRTLLFVRPNYFLVLDELVSPTGGIEWNFHSRGKFRSTGDNSFIAEAPKAGLMLQYACDVKLEHRMSQYEDESATTHNLVFCPASDAEVMNIAALMIPYPANGNEPPIDITSKPIQGGTWFTVSGSWGTDTLLVRLGKGPMVWSGEQISERIRVIRSGTNPLSRSFG
ncbi:heparinase II/III domain-containing protein [Paenibacillus eucommiae]|uniref:Heparinase II/III-like C-terminal domain-containing protein n=1 Tax=Paenibacillus eucommiae TaxID=1355755 RepID=A0ABS4IS26_9BACL|nr:heparinase II/III family protein [Paenibacillus eucommiae]MBP1989935.1 hypothetical protein [Paenibacillus eucommiae]